MASSLALRFALLTLTGVVGLFACDHRAPRHRRVPTSDAGTTSGTLTTTFATMKPQDPTPAPAVIDGGQVAPLPAWVPDAAALTIVEARDRDRNLGIVAPPASPSPSAPPVGGEGGAGALVAPTP